MTVLVTGATGFVGGHLVDRLVAEGIGVRALARPESDARRIEALVEVARGDLTDVRTLERAADGCSLVYHVAATTSSRVRSRVDLRETNVQGTLNVARAAARAGVERFVHVSTCGVYGFRCAPFADESTPPAPDTPYRRSKAQAERGLSALAAATGLRVVVARLSSVYGPRAKNWVRICRSIQSGAFRRIGSGRNRVHLCHVSDVVSGLRACAEAPGIDGRTYNLAGPAPISMDGLVDALSRALGARRAARVAVPGFPIHVLRGLDLAAARALGTRPRRIGTYDLFLADRCFDISRARAELGWNPVVEAEEGLAELVAHYRDEGLLGVD